MYVCIIDSKSQDKPKPENGTSWHRDVFCHLQHAEQHGDTVLQQLIFVENRPAGSVDITMQDVIQQTRSAFGVMIWNAIKSSFFCSFSVSFPTLTPALAYLANFFAPTQESRFWIWRMAKQVIQDRMKSKVRLPFIKFKSCKLWETVFVHTIWANGVSFRVPLHVSEQ